MQIPDDGTGCDVTSHEARFGFRLFAQRYFVRLAFGTERRSGERLHAEGQVPVPVAPVAYGLVGSVFFFLFGVLCFVYLLKAMAGINLFKEASFLHPIYSLFFE